MVVDLDEHQELLTIGLPRRLYDLMKSYGSPRQIITNALMTQERPKRNLRTMPLDDDGNC